MPDETGQKAPVTEPEREPTPTAPPAQREDEEPKWVKEIKAMIQNLEIQQAPPTPPEATKEPVPVPMIPKEKENPEKQKSKKSFWEWLM